MPVSIKAVVIFLAVAVVALTLTISLSLSVRSHSSATSQLNDVAIESINSCNEQAETSVVGMFTKLADAKLEVVHVEIERHLGQAKLLVQSLEYTLASHPDEELHNVTVYTDQLPWVWDSVQDGLLSAAAFGTQDTGIYFISAPPMLAITDEGVTTAGTPDRLGNFIDEPCDEDALRKGMRSGPCQVTPWEDFSSLVTPALNSSIEPHWKRSVNTVGHVSLTVDASVDKVNFMPGKLHVAGITASVDLSPIEDICKSEAVFDEYARVFVMQKGTGLLLAASHDTPVHVSGKETHIGVLSEQFTPHVATESVDAETRILAEFIAHREDGDEHGEHEEHKEHDEEHKEHDEEHGEDVNHSDKGHTHAGASLVDVGGEVFLLAIEELHYDELELLACFALPLSRMHAEVFVPPPPDQEMSIAMWVVAPVTALIVVAAVACGVTVLVRPIAELREEMELVSLLQLEVVKQSEVQNSMLKEVDSMQVSFRAMVASIEELTAFLPASLVGRIESTDDEQTIQPDASVSTNSRRISSQPTTGASSGAENIKGAMRVKLIPKYKLTEVFIGLSAFDRYVRETCNKEELFDVTEFHSRYIQTILSEAVGNQGSLVRFHADEVLVDFKGLTACSSATDKAARFALAVATEHNKMWVHPYCKAHVGVGYGTCYVGNLGIEHVKSMSVLGEAYNLARVMQSVAVEQGLSVVVTKAFSDKVQDIYVSLPVDMIAVDGRKVQAHSLEEKLAAESWMYNCHNSLVSEYEKAWECLMSGEINDAVSLFRVIGSQADPASVAGVARKVLPKLQQYRKQINLISVNSSPGARREYCKVFSEAVLIPTPAHETHDKHDTPLHHCVTSFEAA